MAEYFYHKTIHTITSVFGTIFNNIYVAREDEDGNLTNQKRVPLLYGPQQKFLSRIEGRETLETDHGAISLPIISFESEAPVYDPERQMLKNQKQTCPADDGTGTRVFQPTPYRLPFVLSIMTKNHNEALQILEQILPRFAPSLSVKINPLQGFTGITDNIKITLNGVSKSDNYEGDFQTRRELIYTLSFDVMFFMFNDVKTSQTLIKKTIISHLDMDENPIMKETAAVNPQEASESDPHTIDITWEFGDD